MWPVCSISFVHQRRLGLAVFAGCLLLISLTLLSMYDTYMNPFSSTLCFQSARIHSINTASLNVEQSDTNPMCDVSGRKSIHCEMHGDIRINGKASSIVSGSRCARNETWGVKPYARKGDRVALKHVREVSLRCLIGNEEVAPQCTINQSIPAIVFSAGGYAGNLFHDYSDVLIPLFLTTHHYQGEVQLLVTNAQAWWLQRHRQELSQITRYQIIEFDNDSEVRCYSDVIVGLHAHKEFGIDPLRAPIGHSMANFTQFMRRSYSLKRDTLNQIGGVLKPRVLIIARKRTRSFTNINQIVQMAAETGYEVVVKEPGFGTDMAEVANIVNSCDMMIGVHGAGLSNLVFLPENAVLIQIIPYGKLEGIGQYSFGLAAGKAKLKYIQYEISLMESSLMEEYPKDHPVIANPDSIHKQGWSAVKNVYLAQNITLDVMKFRPVLIEALKLLQDQDDM